MSGVSAYYPPRADWRSRFRYRLHRLRTSVRAKIRPRKRRVLAPDPVLSVVVPGYALLKDRPRLAIIAMVAYAISFGVFLVRMGFPAADWAYTVLLSIHASSIAFFAKRWDSRLRVQLVAGVLLAICLHLYVYDWVRDRFIVPLNTPDGVVIAYRTAPRGLHRGDWIAYRIARNYGTGYYVNEGFGIGPILAIPGDRVDFISDGYAVNGHVSPTLPGMPKSGAMILDAGQWFVWPRGLDLGAYRNLFLVESRIPDALNRYTALLRGLSIITADTFVGKPFDRWFGRKQVLHL